LPPSYVQRFVEELTDHFQDITEETMRAEENVWSRLGEPDQVADAAVTAYKRRSFLGRHPALAFLVFGVSPVVSLFALVALATGSMWIFDEACNRLGANTKDLIAGLGRFGPSASVALAYLGSLLIVVIPSILASILYCWLARRLGIGTKWILLSCAMLAVLSALFFCTAKVSAIPEENWLRLGFNSPQHISRLYGLFVWIVFSPRQLMQFLVPLVIGCWFLRCKGGQPFDPKDHLIVGNKSIIEANGLV